MSKVKKFLEDLKKRAPKGVDPKKHERCVQDVKQQGHGVGSAHAICTASMKKATHKDSIPGGKADKNKPSDFNQAQLVMGIKVEMEHTNDRKIAQEIAMDHLAEDPKYYSKLKTIHTEKSKSASDNVNPGKGLSGKIARHNMSKLHKFAKKHKMNKSVDFQNAKVSVDSADQLLAEKTASPKLISYIKASLANDISKIPFAKGMLTLSKKDEGLYNGFFQDLQGQVIEKFDDMTPEIVAKNMEMKSLYGEVPAQPALPVHDAQEEAEDRIIAQQEAIKIVDGAHQRIDMVHNRIDQLQNDMGSKAKTLRVTFGDFQLELRKSVRDFVDKFKKSNMEDSETNPEIIKKAIESWRNKNKNVMDLPNFSAAAKELFNNWDEHKEGFSQIVYAIEQLER